MLEKDVKRRMQVAKDHLLWRGADDKVELYKTRELSTAKRTVKRAGCKNSKSPLNVGKRTELSEEVRYYRYSLKHFDD